MIDMIARAQRMLGRAVLFPFGLDRNGINIERTVEKKTARRSTAGTAKAFIQECRKEIEAIGNGLLELAVRVGMSADFDHTYYTDSDGVSQATSSSVPGRSLGRRARTALSDPV